MKTKYQSSSDLTSGDSASTNPMDGSDKGVALNRVIWLLSEALGLVPSGESKISVEISDVVNSACEYIKRHGKDKEHHNCYAELPAQNRLGLYKYTDSEMRDYADRTHIMRTQDEADMFWDAEEGERFGHDIADIISDYGPGDKVKIDCAKRLPSVEVLVVADGADVNYQIINP